MPREGGSVFVGHAKPLRLRPETTCRTVKVSRNGFPTHSSQSDGDHGIFASIKTNGQVAVFAERT
jgi:hypothetical protein